MSYGDETRHQILELLKTGMTLRQVCRMEGMPTETLVRKWAFEDADFSSQYALARRIGYESMADEVLEIADDGSNDWMEREGKKVVDTEALGRSRLRVDTRKWLLSKALPKVYGEKLEINDVSENKPAVILPVPMSPEQWAEKYGAKE